MPRKSKTAYNRSYADPGAEPSTIPIDKFRIYFLEDKIPLIKCQYIGDVRYIVRFIQVPYRVMALQLDGTEVKIVT